MTIDVNSLYPQGLYGEEEIDAVLRVLRSGSLAIGENVRAMEARVAALAGKQIGMMVNSGTSALFLAVELLGLEPGDEVITSPVTFSVDVGCLIRAGLTPVFVDVEHDTFNADASQIEELVTERTKAILLPNLVGGTPDWDIVREIADRHSLQVIEDSCDALGTTLRGTPTGTRSDMWLTSFANSHIICAGGNGGMLCYDDPAMHDRALMLRRWGRRHELLLFGSQQPSEPIGARSFWSPLDGVDYDNLYIFDEVGWNFEPSEMGAAFGVRQLDRLEENFSRRREIFAMYTQVMEKHRHAFVQPREVDGLRTAWLQYPFLVRPEAGFTRRELHDFLESRGIYVRTVWSGNMARQPILRKVHFRQPPGGLPNADRVMEHGVVLPGNHGLGDEQVRYITSAIDEFASTHTRGPGT